MTLESAIEARFGTCRRPAFQIEQHRWLVAIVVASFMGRRGLLPITPTSRLPAFKTK